MKSIEKKYSKIYMPGWKKEDVNKTSRILSRIYPALFSFKITFQIRLCWIHEPDKLQALFSFSHREYSKICMPGWKKEDVNKTSRILSRIFPALFSFKISFQIRLCWIHEPDKLQALFSFSHRVHENHFHRS